MSEPRKGLSKGCTIALIIAAVFTVVIIALSVLCIKNPDKLIEIGLKPIGAEVKNFLPEGYTPEMVDQGINDFVQAFRDRKINEVELQQVLFLGRKFISKRDLTEEDKKAKALEFLNEMKQAIDN